MESGKDIGGKVGQTMVEYVIVAAALLGAVIAALALAKAAQRAAEHSKTVVASPYP